MPKLKYLFPQKKYSDEYKVLEDLVKLYRNIANQKINYGKHITQFCTDLQILIDKLLPDQRHLFTTYISNLQEISRINEKHGEFANRLYEDINDIFISLTKLEEKDQQMKDADEAHIEASNDVIAAKGEDLYESKRENYETKKEALRNKIEKAVAIKREKQSKMKTAIEILIEEKTRYNTGKVRRIKEAYERYIDFVTKYSDSEAELHRLAIESLKDASSLLPHDIVENIIETTPQPAIEKEGSA